MYDDCSEAWEQLDHNYLGPKAHQQTGMTLDVDGNDDDQISHDLKPIWYSKELGMPTVRKTLIKQVKLEVTNEVYTSFSQWPELMEHYPEHPAIFEGARMHPRTFGWRRFRFRPRR